MLELCEILNISEAGMCIQASGPMKVNRLLPLVLDLSETGERIHTTGHVVWSDPDGKTGIRFPEMPENSREQLQNWLSANAAAGILAAEKQEIGFRPPTLTARPGSASSYTSLVNEWADIEKEIDLFGPELEPALQLLARKALSLTWASGAAIALMNKLKPSELICRARAGADSPELGARLQAGSGFSGECVRSATTLKCDDAQTDSRVDRNSCRALGIRSLIACPVKRRTGEVIGIVEVFSPEIAAFWDNDSTVLERLARVIATAVGRAEHARPDILAVDPSSDEQETNLFANTLRSLHEQEFPKRQPSFARKFALSAVGISALVIAFWLSAPWIREGVAKVLHTSSPPSAEASLSEDSYAGTDLKDLRRLAVSGNPGAQYSLGLRYGSGDGVPRDYREAVSWFLKSADQGDLRAAAKLASCFWTGKGTQQDYSRAYFWGLLAQTGGSENAEMARLIVMQSAPHLSPAHIAREQQEADKWLHAHHIGLEKEQ